MDIITSDYRLHLVTAIGLALVIVAIVMLARRAHRMIRLAQGDLKVMGSALSNADGVTHYYRSKVNKYSKLFGPFPELFEREEKEKWDHNEGTVAVDLDGVILEYDGTWRGPNHFGQPIEGLKAGLETIRRLGFRIAIYSCRNNPMAPSMKGDALSLTCAIKQVLDFHEIPYDYIALFKPLARYYIDDRAIRFYNWPQAIGELAILEGRRRGYLKEVAANNGDPGTGPIPKDPKDERIEQLTAQLAGCSVAALGGEIVAMERNAYGWSPAYADVIDLRRKYEFALSDNLDLRKAIDDQEVRIEQYVAKIAKLTRKVKKLEAAK